MSSAADADPAPIEVVVPEALAGDRLDRALVSLLADGPAGPLSRSRLQRLIKDGHVEVDGRAEQRPNLPVDAGDRISVALQGEQRAATDVEGRTIAELQVLHEDASIVVIDKQAGLVSHPSSVPRGGSVSELAEARFGPLPSAQGPLRHGIVHRLDRLTSGVMVLARTEEALGGLMRQFRMRTVEKTYFALVHGEPRFDSDWIDAPIAPHPKSPDRQRIATATQLEDGEAREAETYYEVRERFPGAAWVECKPTTGRTHQIRVHLLHVGLPIIGDRVYSHPGALPWPLPESVPIPERQALHAAALRIRHPTTGEKLRFEAPLPADLESTLAGLRAML